VRTESRSWIDLLLGALNRLPGRTGVWLAALAAVEAAALWTAAGPDADPMLRRVLLAAAVWTMYPLAAIHYLDGVGGHAVDRFRPAMDVDDPAYLGLRSDFATMPMLPVLLANGVGVLCLLLALHLSPALFAPLAALGEFRGVVLAVYGVNFALGGALVYHSVRQLGLVGSAFSLATRIDVTQPAPLYALAGLAVRTGIAWSLVLSLSVVLFPAMLRSPVSASLLVMLVAIAVAAAVTPLLGVHRRLADQKNRLLADADAHLQQGIRLLHSHVAAGDLAAVDQVSRVIATLITARDVQNRIATWPWPPGTVAALVSALMLPIFLTVAQRLIGLWFQ
jgi:hypothetical protein